MAGRRFQTLKSYRLRNYNFVLVISIMLLNIFGILVVTSADSNYQDKQIIGMVAGFIVMTIVSLIDYNKVLKFYWPIYGLACIFLFWVIFGGDDGKGAQRWLIIGSVRFQPSEIVKIMLIVFFAAFFMKFKEKLNTFRYVVLTLVLIAVPLGLIYEQPDLSTMIMVAFIFVSLFFVSGVSYKVIGILLAIFVPIAATFFYLISRPGQTILEQYQYNRIMSFRHPELYADQWYQQENSMIAIGSGGLLGKGLYNNDAMSVKNGNYISEAHNDFIFAIVGEELGFAGSVALILLLFFICLQCILIGRKSKDLAGKLICCGVTALIGFQSFTNIAVVTGMLPNTGLPLPFVSYGLTSLISCYIGMGLVLNVGLQRARTY